MLPRFSDPSLLERALTHTSYANELAQEKGQLGRGDAAQDNERLEFLGDAILDFIAAAWLFRRYPEFHEGRLTSLRAALVRATTLARIAEDLGLPDLLRLGKGELETGGKRRANILGDAFEATLGALFLDQGIAAVREFLEPLLDQYAAGILSENLDRDPKSLLQEWSQEELAVTPRYRLVSADGPAHHRTFTVEVVLGERVAATGVGFNKQAAEQMAAREALRLAGLDETEAVAGAEAHA